MTYDKTELALLALPANAKLIIEPAMSRINEDAATIAALYRIVRLNGRLLIEAQEPYPHFVPFTKQYYSRITYRLFAEAKRSYVNSVFDCLSYSAPDLSDNDHLILFGNLADPKARLSVWDMDRLAIRADIAPEDCVRRSPYPMEHSPFTQSDRPIPFILNLAGGDKGLYSDVMQSLAPLIMVKKPVGVIWLVGDDAIGKTTLLDALNMVFPDQLANLTVKRMIGGRSNTLSLNGMLGNVAEASDSQVTDLEIYKSIGTHENFNMHRYHSQQGAVVQGNVHHIFSASNYPTFSTRGQSVDWRTHIIPVNQQLDINRTYTLTDSLLGELISEMCRYAIQLRRQGYCYEWSAATIAAQANYSPKDTRPNEVYNHPNLAPAPFRW
jgi:hypothetical protein